MRSLKGLKLLKFEYNTPYSLMMQEKKQVYICSARYIDHSLHVLLFKEGHFQWTTLDKKVISLQDLDFKFEAG